MSGLTENHWILARSPGESRLAEIGSALEGGLLNAVASLRELESLSEPFQPLATLGEALFELAFPTADSVVSLVGKIQAAHNLKRGLLLRIDATEPWLWSLPWEYLRVPARHLAAFEGVYSQAGEARAQWRYLSLCPYVSVARGGEADLVREPVEAPRRLRVLVASADPYPSPALAGGLSVDLELNRIAEGLRHYTYIDLKVLHSTTVRDLESTFEEFSPHVFHFIGHGAFPGPDKAVEPCVLLHGNDGEAEAYSGPQLRRLCLGREVEPGTQLVVLNCCWGGRTDADVPGLALSLSEVQEGRAGVPAVVSAQFRLPDNLATGFSGYFYPSLTTPLRLDVLLREYRQVLTQDAAWLDLPGWGALSCYLSVESPELFVQREDTLSVPYEGPSSVMADELSGLASLVSAVVGVSVSGVSVETDAGARELLLRVRVQSDDWEAYVGRRSAGLVALSEQVSRLEYPEGFRGRGPELGRLRGLWEEVVVGGEGRVVSIQGAQGIGKTRLTQELRRGLVGEAHSYLRYECDVDHKDEPYYPVRRQLLELFRTSARLPRPLEVVRLEWASAGASGRVDAGQLSAVGALLRDKRFAAEDRRSALHRQLVDLLVSLSATSPVLLVVEDAQWLDASTGELLGAVLGALPKLRVLIIVVSHVGSRPSILDGVLSCEDLRLGRLPDEDIKAIVYARLPSKAPIEAPVLERIVELSEGVPFDTEPWGEWIRERLRSGPIRGVEELDEQPELASIAVLDDELRRVIQAVAVIGREVSVDTLSGYLRYRDVDTNDLEKQLSRLERSGPVDRISLLVRTGETNTGSVRFSHGLWRRAALDSVRESSRPELYDALVKYYEGELPSYCKQQPGILAKHCGAAGQFEKAARYALEATRQAIGLHAHREAYEHAAEGLKHRGAVMATQRGAAILAELRLQQGLALRVLEGSGYEGLEDILGDAANLASSANIEDIYLSATVARSIYWFMRSDFPKGNAFDSELIARGEAGNKPWFVGLGFLGKAATLLFSAQYAECIYSARRYGEISNQYRDEVRETGAIAATLDQPFHPWLAFSEWALGRADEATALMEEGVNLAIEIGDPSVKGYVLSWKAWLAGCMRDSVALEETLEVLEPLCREFRLRQWAVGAKWSRAIALGLQKNPEQGLKLAHAALADWMAFGTNLCVPWIHLTIADLYLSWASQGESASGSQSFVNSVSTRADVALVHLGSGALIAKSTGQYHLFPEFYRLTGYAKELVGNTREAEESYRRAIECAAGQGSKYLELRALVNLFQLSNSDGAFIEYNDGLRAICESFPEGDNTADLRTARGALEGCPT